jgi:F-type H+-transporting ATPase subunit epsilon
MADKALVLEICALDRAPLRVDVSEVGVPGTLGLFVVLPGHAPLLSTLEIGILTARFLDGREHFFAINGGFCQVKDDHVLVLAQTVEMDTEIDIARAHAARQRAEARLKEVAAAEAGAVDVARAEAALKRALVRLRAAGQG